MITDLNAASPHYMSWDNQKIKLLSKFKVLIEADLLFAEGKKEEMMEKLQVKLGKTKEELSDLIATL